MEPPIRPCGSAGVRLPCLSVLFRARFAVAKTFYGRDKVRLADYRSVRAELCVVYRACVDQQLDWDAGRAAALILSRIAGMDEAAGLEARIAALEAADQDQLSGRPNGHHHPGARA